MKIVKHYYTFNARRYGNPWVAKVNPKTAKPDFREKVGGYTGAYGQGDEGDLYVYEPTEGAVYMYGQKDHRGNNGDLGYVKFMNGEFVGVTSATLLEELQ